MKTYINFVNGIAIVPKAGAASDTKGELEFLTTTNKLYVHNGTVSDPIVSETVAATLTNKILSGNTAATLISGSGTLTLNTSGTITLPNGTDTLVGLALTQTLTNKTLTGNTAVNLVSGAGTLTLNTSGTVTLPNATDTLVGKATTDTLTNKSMDGATNTFTNIPAGALPATVVYTTATQTLTNKTLSGNTAATLISGAGTLTLNTSGTVTLPNATDTLVGRATTDTLTNKTLTGNTAATLVSGAGTLTLNTSGTITVPNGTDTLVGKATVDTLTNKTLTSPVINTPTTDTVTGIAAAPLTIQPASGQNLVLSSNGAGVISHDNITFKTNTISTSAGALTLNATSGNNIFINGSGTGTIQLQRSGSTILTVDTGGITLSASKTIGTGTGTLTLNSSGAITVPNTTDTLVGQATTDTLSNKTIAAGVNTITGLTNTNLSGSAAITNANLATVATQTFKGRTTAGTGAPEDMTATQATAILNTVVGDAGAGGTKGLVPAPGAGDAAASKFLKADGTWAATPSGFANPMTTAGDIIYGGAAGAATRLGIGATGSFLQATSSTAVGWTSDQAYSATITGTMTTSSATAADLAVSGLTNTAITNVGWPTVSLSGTSAGWTFTPTRLGILKFTVMAQLNPSANSNTGIIVVDGSNTAVTSDTVSNHSAAGTVQTVTVQGFINVTALTSVTIKLRAYTTAGTVTVIKTTLAVHY